MDNRQDFELSIERLKLVELRNQQLLRNEIFILEENAVINCYF